MGPSTVRLCRRILDSDPDLRQAHLVALAGSPKEPDDTARGILTIPISFSTTFFGHPEFSVPLLSAVRAMLEKGALRPASHEIGSAGLSGIKDALLRLELGQVGSMRKSIVDVRGPDQKKRIQKKKQADGASIVKQIVGVKRKATHDGEEQRASKAVSA